MKPHPRIRKTIKWGGAAVTVLLVMVWIGSYWKGFVGFGQDHSSFTVMIRGGFYRSWHIHTRRDDMSSRVTGFGVFSPDDVPGWPSIVWPSISLSGIGTEGALWIPLWLPVLAALIPTTWAWRLDTIARRRKRAIRLNLCPKCNYDRAGIAGDAKCPECGASRDTGA